MREGGLASSTVGSRFRFALINGKKLATWPSQQAGQDVHEGGAPVDPGAVFWWALLAATGCPK